MNLFNPGAVFGVVGGDFRQAALAKGLLEDGYPVRVFCIERPPQFLPSQLCCENLDGLSGCDAVILPLPVSNDDRLLNAPLSPACVPLCDLFSRCRSDALLFGGKVSPAQQRLAQQFGHTIHDYLEREEMAVLNAVPTAEGAVNLAMNERASTLWESRCLVTGFGRCAKALALLLKGFGARVTVAARREGDLAFARTLGLQTIPLRQLQEVLPQQEIVFNTIPAPVLTRPLLEQLQPECLIIDLASRPGGVDFEAAGELGLKTIWALSLPGKVAPITAGGIIRDTVLHMMADLAGSCPPSPILSK